MIDLHKIHIGDSIWYKGKECIVTMIRKDIDYNIKYPEKEIVWALSLIDKITYLNEYTNSNISINDPVATGDVLWDCIKEDCFISNAIDFIRS